MNISALLVLVDPKQLAEGVDTLNAQSGIEVFHTDAETGRVVVIQEAASIHEEVESMKALKALPQVLNVDLVSHYFGDDNQLVALPPEDLDALQGIGHKPVPDYLNKATH